MTAVDTANELIVSCMYCPARFATVVDSIGHPCMTPDEEPPTMARTITDSDMSAQVITALGFDADDYDDDAIVDQIKSEYGLIDIDTIPHDDFWAIAFNHQHPAPAGA